MTFNWQAVTLALGAAVFSHQVSFRVGSKTVTASDESGAPVHFTYGAALVAAEAVLAGQTGTIQVGNIKVTVS